MASNVSKYVRNIRQFIEDNREAAGWGADYFKQPQVQVKTNTSFYSVAWWDDLAVAARQLAREGVLRAYHNPEKTHYWFQDKDDYVTIHVRPVPESDIYAGDDGSAALNSMLTLIEDLEEEGVNVNDLEVLPITVGPVEFPTFTEEELTQAKAIKGK